jgi:hypothetical protein
MIRPICYLFIMITSFSWGNTLEDFGKIIYPTLKSSHLKIYTHKGRTVTKFTIPSLPFKLRAFSPKNIVFSGAVKSLDFSSELTIKGTFALSPLLSIPITGTVNISTQSATLTLPRKVIQLSTLESAAKSHGLNLPIHNTRGTLAIGGTLSIKNGALRPNITMDLMLHKTTLISDPEFVIKAIKGAFHYTNPSYISIKNFSAQQLGFFSNIKAVGLYKLAKQRLKWQTCTAQLWGGVLDLNGTTFPSRKPQKIILNDIDFANLLQFINIDGLSAAGKLSGTIPLKLNPDFTLSWDTTTLNSPSGHINYEPAQKAAGQPSVDMTLNLLQNFIYKPLAFTLQKGSITDKFMTFILNIEGKNPNFLSGYPAHFNINLQAPIWEMLRSTQTQARMAKAIEHKAKKSAQKH